MEKKYDKTIGYASFNKIDKTKIYSTINLIKILIKRKTNLNSIKKILVAGCGNGVEASVISEIFDKKTIGVDISFKNEQIQFTENLELQKQDLMRLSFENGAFSFIYSYHVLEHVPNHIVVLKELKRVLSNEGILFIGFPNKNRLVGYVGAQNDITFKQKIMWNLNDYQQRLLGKFENKFGAHAGFTQNEFLRDSEMIFKDVIPVRNEYFLNKYSKYKQIIKLLIKLKVEKYLFPSNYYICKK